MFGPEDDEEAQDTTDTTDDGSEYEDRVTDGITGGLDQEESE